MLGRAVAARLADRYEVLSWDLPELDITDRERTWEQIAAAAPALVVNCAALVDLEGCERDPDRAWQVNAVGARNVATAAQRCAATLFYISSDYVFDGATDGSYDAATGGQTTVNCRQTCVTGGRRTENRGLDLGYSAAFRALGRGANRNVAGVAAGE